MDRPEKQANSNRTDLLRVSPQKLQLHSSAERGCPRRALFISDGDTTNILYEPLWELRLRRSRVWSSYGRLIYGNTYGTYTLRRLGYMHALGCCIAVEDDWNRKMYDTLSAGSASYDRRTSQEFQRVTTKRSLSRVYVAEDRTEGVRHIWCVTVSGLT